MKLGVTIVALVGLTGCSGCQPAAGPSGAQPTDESVYGVLVAGGCLAASDGGVAAVAAEHASPNPAWLDCLYKPGGTVSSCGVPCGK